MVLSDQPLQQCNFLQVALDCELHLRATAVAEGIDNPERAKTFQAPCIPRTSFVVCTSSSHS